MRGVVHVNDERADWRSLVEFGDEGEELSVRAESDSLLVLGHCLPLNEQVVFGGPFVMNSAREIEEAYQDYESGKFGTWP